MDYEKKYYEVFNLIMSIYSVLKGREREEVERVLPELKEKKGARMIRAILHVLDENYNDAAVIEGVEIAEIKAWLEEQSKKLDANEVIAWMKSFGYDITTLVQSFKEHFGLN